MKILREYVWDTIRRNKRTSIAIMTALFLMTTMMSCFCGFVYTMWTDAIALTKMGTVTGTVNSLIQLMGKTWSTSKTMLLSLQSS